MDTKIFRTKQETLIVENPKAKKFVIGLDVGYSGTKVYTESKIFCFPSYVKKLGNDMLSVSSANDILYKDLNSGDMYMVGYAAQDMIASDNTNDTDGEMYSRKRYSNPNFHVICKAALGIAMMDLKDQREVVIQTGLPTSYVKGDTIPLKKVLSEHSQFALKIGTGEWVSFDFKVKEENIFVMPQPAGSLYSILIKDNGEYRENAKDYLFNNLLIMDIGFGTFDFYGLKSRAIACTESVDDIGMRKVFSSVSAKILEEMNEDIRVQALQKNLETGTVVCIDEEELCSQEKSIEDILESSNKEVFMEAFQRARAITNTFRDYKYIIVSGGTGEAWYEMIKDALSKMNNLEILPGNLNSPELPFIYANVRGYYLYRYSLLKK